MADSPPLKPVSEADELTEPFFAAGEEGRLLLATCSVCGEMRLPTAPACPSCLGEGFEWNEVSGRGRVYTFAIMHQRYHPAWGARPALQHRRGGAGRGAAHAANIIGVENDAIAVGMPVEVVWEREGDAPVPRFRPVA